MSVMNLYVWNFALALIWAMAAGELSLLNFTVGFLLGLVAIWFAEPAMGASRYVRRIAAIVGFAVFILWELLLSNLRVALDVVKPRYLMRPGIVAVPLDAETDLEIALLATVITLTPGTVMLDVSEDRKTIYIHAMFVGDAEQFRKHVKEGYERRVLNVLR